jgi:DNA-binding winged helix-turn-helix (wHTH) protein/hemoglobin-like flavoprotein
VIAFDDFSIDPLRFELRRGTALVPVEPKVLDVIVFLAENASRVVSRDELLGAIWSDVSVGDAALSRAIREARRVLGDDGNSQRVIKTVHGRGYRFAAQLRPAAATAPARSASAPVEPPSETPPFGREAVIGRFVALFERAQATAGSALLLVRGAPGIGKTCVLERCLDLARERGALAVLGRTATSRGAPAFWPWVQTTRALFDRLETDERARLPADVIRVLEPLWSSIRTLAYDDDAARFGVLDASSRFFAAVAESRPVVVAIDDLHAADTGSRVLAEWLTVELRRSRVVFLFSARLDEPRGISASVSAVADADVLLEGLSVDGVARWLAAHQTGDVAADVAARVHEATRGNPLFIRHLLHAMKDGVVPAVEAGVVPHPLRDAIAQHLATLDADDRAFLEAASAAGDQFLPADIAIMLGEGIERVLPRIERLLARGWVQPSRGQIGHYELSHALVRGALYDGIPPERRATLHERVGVFLAESVDAPPELLAYHLTRAPAPVRIGRGIDAAFGAAHESFHKCAFDRTASHCRAALEVMSLTGRDHPRRAEALMLLASALGRDGDLEGAARVLGPTRSSRPPAAISLEAAERELVRESFARVAPRMQSLVQSTYDRLFESRPELRTLFRRNQPRVQELMVAETLTSVIDHLEDHPWLESMLWRLGHGHRSYGVTKEMFGWLGDALLESLADELGPTWTPPVADAWRRAYRSVSELAIAGLVA